MFTFFKSFTRTFILILGGLIVLGSLAKCVTPKEQKQSLKIEASGECGLPGITAESSFSKGKEPDAKEECLLYVMKPDWHTVSNPRQSSSSSDRYCAINGFDYLGLEGKHKFMVGRTWLILPIWQEEDVCTVFLEKDKWQQAKERKVDVATKGLFAADRIEDASFYDQDFNRYQIDITIAYPKEFANAQDFKEFLAKSTEDLRARIRAFHGENARYAFTLKQKLNQEDLKYLRHELCRITGTETYTEQVSCLDHVLAAVENRHNNIAGLGPEQRKEIALELASARSQASLYNKKNSYSAKARQESLEYGFLHAKDDEFTRKAERPVIEKHQLTEEQVKAIKAESFSLGWPLEELDKLQRGRQ